MYPNVWSLPNIGPRSAFSIINPSVGAKALEVTQEQLRSSVLPVPARKLFTPSIEYDSSIDNKLLIKSQRSGSNHYFSRPPSQPLSFSIDSLPFHRKWMDPSRLLKNKKIKDSTKNDYLFGGHRGYFVSWSWNSFPGTFLQPVLVYGIHFWHDS